MPSIFLRTGWFHLSILSGKIFQKGKYFFVGKVRFLSEKIKKCTTKSHSAWAWPVLPSILCAKLLVGIIDFSKIFSIFFEISLKKRLNPEKASAKSEKKLCVTGFAGRTETMSVLNYLKWRKIDHDFVSIYPLQESGLFIETSVALSNENWPRKKARR